MRLKQETGCSATKMLYAHLPVIFCVTILQKHIAGVRTISIYIKTSTFLRALSSEGGFKAEKGVPEHIPERRAAASQSLRAGLAAAHCSVRQQNETSAEHGRADAGIHEKPYLSSTCDFFLSLNCTCNGVRSFIRNLNGDKVGAFHLCPTINCKKYLHPWVSSAQTHRHKSATCHLTGLFSVVAVTAHPSFQSQDGHWDVAPASQIAARLQWQSKERQLGLVMQPWRPSGSKHEPSWHRDSTAAFLPKPKAKEITFLPLPHHMNHCVLRR